MFKLNCGFDLCSTDKNISDYAKILCDDVIDIEVEIISRKMATIKPFSGWNSEKAKQSLFWWKAFDEIKHNRSEMFDNASLRNVLWSLCALFVLENVILKRIAEEYMCVNVPGSYSCLFRMKDWEYNATILNKYIEEDLEQFARDIGINDDDLFLPEE